MKIILAALAILIAANGELAPQASLGSPVRIGGIELTVQKVEIRKIKLEQPAWPNPKLIHTEQMYTVVTFKIANVTEFQAIDPDEIVGKMEDQYGNIHKQVWGDEICPDCKILEAVDPIEMFPGDSQILVAIFQAPKIPKSEIFNIHMTMVVDNRGTKEKAQIAFKKTDINK